MKNLKINLQNDYIKKQTSMKKNHELNFFSDPKNPW